ncbi:sugar phosphate isomerase/epimerase family protein [Sphingobacterium populi]
MRMARRHTLIYIVFVLIIGGCASSNKMQRSRNHHPETKLGWQLGAQAYTFKKFTFSEAVVKIASCDLHYVEAYPQQEIGGGIQEKMDYHMSEDSRKYIKKLLKANNMRWQAYGVIKAKDATEWRKVFEFAKSMGIETITCEPDIAMLDEISKLCDEFDIRAAIHNHASPSYYWQPETVLQAIQGKSNKIGVAADIGHWLRSGLDPVASLKKLEGKVFHLHFKDLNEQSSKKAHDVHWGTGAIDIPGVIAELKRQQFAGMIAAEYEYNWDNNVEDVRISVENFRKIVTELTK